MADTVTHMAYSHSDVAHIGASSLFGADVVRIGHAGSGRLPPGCFPASTSRPGSTADAGSGPARAHDLAPAGR